MARKTEEERLVELEQKMEQLKARKQKIESQLKQKSRKERTRRLIQIGAIFEKYFNVVTVEEAELVAQALYHNSLAILQKNSSSEESVVSG